MRPTDLMPKVMMEELLRVVKADRNWLKWKRLEGDTYTAECVEDTWLRKLWIKGSDAFSMWAYSIWLVDGPKIFRPTTEQAKALEQVEVNLTLADYSQPYPALLVVLPKGLYDPFTSVLCHKSESMLTCALTSVDRQHDITTTVARWNSDIEESLQSYDEDCQELSSICSRALRVACNSCLALSSYGSHLEYLFPKDVESDRRLAKERTERGERARQRLPLAVMVASLDQNVVLHRTEQRKANEDNPTGRQMPFHWRRGHWHTVAHGAGKTERKRVLYPPVMIRADLLLGDPTSTSVNYSTTQTQLTKGA